MTAKQEKLTQDEALAKTLSEMLKEQPSGEGYLLGVATKLRHEVIDPAVIAGSLKLLKAHRNALYDAMPTGVDLTAMDLLNIIQVHLGKVDASIESLENSLKPFGFVENHWNVQFIAQNSAVIESKCFKNLSDATDSVSIVSIAVIQIRIE